MPPLYHFHTKLIYTGCPHIFMSCSTPGSCIDPSALATGQLYTGDVLIGSENHSICPTCARRLDMDEDDREFFANVANPFATPLDSRSDFDSASDADSDVPYFDLNEVAAFPEPSEDSSDAASGSDSDDSMAAIVEDSEDEASGSDGDGGDVYELIDDYLSEDGDSDLRAVITTVANFNGGADDELNSVLGCLVNMDDEEYELINDSDEQTDVDGE